MLERRIEEVSLNSWPALQHMFFDGWIVRFAKGYTKRANSVTLIDPSSLSVQEKIVACESFYQKQQLPTIFRLPSFSPDTQKLDPILAERKYQLADLTRVLYIEITPRPTQYHPAQYNVSLANVSLKAWLPLFCQFKQAFIEQHQIHAEILKQIVPDPLFSVLYKDGHPLACGLGVLENGFFGLFDIVTAPDQRNKGYGTQLVTAMLDWARQNGANHAYLQVVDTNHTAQRMYAKFGFQELYTYWYRIQSL